MPAAVAIPAIVGAVGSVGGATISAMGARDAASTQASAYQTAADKQAETTKNALAFQKEMFSKAQENLSPWLESGKQSLNQITTALNNLATGVHDEFNPTLDESTDPGFQARLALGQQAVTRSLAARGVSLGGAGVKAGIKYSQDYASNEYEKVWARAQDKYNRLVQSSTMGENAANTLSSEAMQSGRDVSNTMMTGTEQVNQLLTNQATARASGYVSEANALGAGVAGAGKSFLDAYMMNKYDRTPGSMTKAA